MRLTILTICAVTGFLIACGQNRENENDQQKETVEEEAPKTEVPERGQVVERHENGNKKIVIVYAKDGQTPQEERHYHPGGELKIEGGYKGGKKHGVWMAYYEDGKPWSENNYLNGEYHGAYRQWYPNGQLKLEGGYQNGEESGLWKTFDWDGNLLDTKEY